MDTSTIGTASLVPEKPELLNTCNLYLYDSYGHLHNIDTEFWPFALHNKEGPLKNENASLLYKCPVHTCTIN